MSTPQTGRPFLGVNFIDCQAYGRLYKKTDGSAYIGRCPRCGKSVSVPIGSGGTSQRFFKVYCKK